MMHNVCLRRRHPAARADQLVSSVSRLISSWLPGLLALVLVGFATAGCAAPVRVKWSTETEMNTAGFNLYRGESPDGPFDVKVNDQLIPPAQDPLTGGKYQYTDASARPGVTYYYQLQEVETGGGVNKFGPISVRAGALVWWQVGIFGVLALAVAALWVFGGRKDARKRAEV